MWWEHIYGKRREFINMFIAQFVHSIHVELNILKGCIAKNQIFKVYLKCK